MLGLPNEPLPGQHLRASDHAALVRYVRSITPRPGPGRLVNTGSGGSTISGSKFHIPRTLPLAPVNTQPFFVTAVPVDGDTTGDSGYTATIRPGVINGTIFPKVAGTYIWQLVATTSGDPPVTTYAFPTLTIAKGDWIWLQGDVAAGVLTDVNSYNGSTPPSETDNLTVYTVAICDPTTGALTQFLSSNLQYVAEVAYFDAGSRLITHIWSAV